MFKKILIITVVLACIFGISYGVLTSLFPTQYSEYVEKYAEKYSVDPSTIYAIIKAESNFEPAAASHKGAVGLMQITPDTGKWCAEKMNLAQYKTEDLVNPEANINIGVWYFSYLSERMQSEELAIISYNAGMGKVNKWIDEGNIRPPELKVGEIPYQETRKYLKKVMLFTKIYEALYDL